jgi:predicted PurR-regulated permease PerM
VSPPSRRTWYQWSWTQPAPEPDAETRLEFRSRQLRQLASMGTAIWWLAFLATLAAFSIAKALVVPVLFAAFMALSFNPIVHGLARKWFPRSLVAALVVVVGIALLALVVMWVAEPAQHWFERAPGAVRSLAPKLKAMTQQIEAAGRATQTIITLGNTPDAKAAVAPTTPALFDIWEALAATPRLLASIFAVVLLAYFFLVYGDSMLQKTVAMAPSLDHKRNAVDILRTMQSEMSRYLFITALINSAVGVGAALIAWSLNLEDALFWGVLAAILNFIPYIGPLCMTGVFVVVGLLHYDKVAPALIPALCFSMLVILEGQFLTPMILGRRLKLNPVAILLWLMLLGWLWGPVGVVLAVPALVVIKIVCERVHGWDWVARAIE